MPSGASANSPGVGRTGTSGVSNVFATAPLARSTTTSLPDSELARSQWPSFVIMEENAILGREIDRTTELFAVSMTTMRGVYWSHPDHTRRSQIETPPASLFVICSVYPSAVRRDHEHVGMAGPSRNLAHE